MTNGPYQSVKKNQFLIMVSEKYDEIIIKKII